jgi:hypothetical protein
MLDTALSAFNSFDSELGTIIARFFTSYNPYENPPFPSAYLTLFTKIVIYCLFASIPALFLKTIFTESKWPDWIIYFIVTIGGLALLGIFIGILQVFFFSF